MKNILKHKKNERSRPLLAGFIGGILLSLAGVWTVLAQGVPDPALQIMLSGTNLLLKVTNGVSTANYEIYRTPVLGDPAYPWILHLIGALGQTNFTASMGIDTVGFFKANSGLDWDSDGSPNWADAQPSNPAVGTLSITIDSPANGSTVD